MTLNRKKLNIAEHLKRSSFENTNIGFVFWFIFGVSTTLFFYQPFNQPILFDRAYLLHMSQVVARDESLYHATTFGYTPFSTLIVGWFMKIGSLFSINTIESARILGLIIYGTICGSFFVLSKSLFKTIRPTIIACLLFVGLGYIQLVSSLNAEPKLWVMLFSILGIYSYHRKKWLLVGLLFSLATMSWHVSIIGLFGAFIMLPWKTKRFKNSFFKFSMGVFLGILPGLIYLAITNSWIEFWNQAVLRKLIVEAATAGESPFQWIREGIYPFFMLEPIHFLLAFLGFIISVYAIIKGKFNKLIDSRLFKFILVYTSIWTLFNSYDFQTCVDLFPLIPAIVILATYFLISINLKITKKWSIYTIGIALIIYNFYDAALYKLPFTYQDEVKVVKSIQTKYDDPFVIGFEEYYTILEKPMPTKFMRFAHYEDHMIIDPVNGFNPILNDIKSKKHKVIVEFDKNKRGRSDQSAAIFKHFPERNQRIFTRSKSASFLIENLTNNTPVDSSKVIAQTIPFSNLYYTIEHYSVFRIE